VTISRPIPRYVAAVVLLAMAGFAAVGFSAIRRDVENLRVISQDNTQWSASQMEIELLRFRLSLAELLNAPTPEAVDAMHERFDILWSRVFMMGHGRLGESLERYDGEHGSVAAVADSPASSRTSANTPSAWCAPTGRRVPGCASASRRARAGRRSSASRRCS
jgi:hypothetical protein